MNLSGINPNEPVVHRSWRPLNLTHVKRYGLAVISVGLALGVALLFQHFRFRESAVLLLLFACAISSWYGGVGPTVVAVVLSLMGLNYWEEEIQALNQELAKRSKALESSDKELEAFAYPISHDLRAPLRHMAGFAELLRKSAAASLYEKSARYVTMILEAANRMGSLVDDLLAFSRISRAEAHNSVFSLEQLVQEAVTEVRQDASERKIVWKINPLPAWHGDRSMLRLALINLISNAVKFTRPRPQAEIEIGCTEHKEDQVVLFVRDNGVGFDMKYSNKLFGVSGAL